SVAIYSNPVQWREYTRKCVASASVNALVAQVVYPQTGPQAAVVFANRGDLTMAYRPRVLASTAFLVLGLVACSRSAPIPTPRAMISPTTVPASQELTTVRAGVIGGLGEAGQYLAQSQGYFSHEGVAIDFTRQDPSTAF